MLLALLIHGLNKMEDGCLAIILEAHHGQQDHDALQRSQSKVSLSHLPHKTTRNAGQRIAGNAALQWNVAQKVGDGEEAANERRWNCLVFVLSKDKREK